METNKHADTLGRVPELLARTGRWVLHVITPFPDDAPDYMSNHDRGAEHMLADQVEAWAASRPDIKDQEE